MQFRTVPTSWLPKVPRPAGTAFPGALSHLFLPSLMLRALFQLSPLVALPMAEGLRRPLCWERTASLSAPGSTHRRRPQAFRKPRTELFPLAVIGQFAAFYSISRAGMFGLRLIRAAYCATISPTAGTAAKL